MKIDIQIIKKNYNQEAKFVNIGYIELDKFDPERCWELCNWKHWKKEKPQNLHANIYSCNHGVCFTNPDTNEIWMAKSIGWFVGNEIEINDYMQQNINELIWL